MPSTREVASERKPPSKPDTGRPAVKTRAAPRATLIIPRVAMKGGSRPRVISSPLTRPHRAPAARPSAMARGTGNGAWRAAREEDAGEGHDRAHREVDPPGDDHERHAHRDHGVDGGLLEDVEEVGDGEEVRAQDREQPPEEEKPEEGADLPALFRQPGPQAHAGCPSAARSTCSWLVPAASISATIRPWRITRIRSLIPSTSGSSDEIMRMPAPLAVRRFISS